MATPMEEIYSKIVIHRILQSDISTNEKYNTLVDYYCNSSYYYELLCDYTYLLATKDCNLALWISLNGKPQLSITSVNVGDIPVLDSKIVPKFNGDLIDCLNIVFRNMSNILPLC